MKGEIFMSNAYCLMLVINDIAKYETILKKLFDMGIGATSVESMGMGKFLLESDIKIPFFGTIQQMVEGNRPYNKTVFSVIRQKNVLDKAVSMIKTELHLESETGKGFMFVLPVVDYYGFEEEGTLVED